jgi:hypothetical protein
MSFRGELREFELPDILQLISSQKKAGWLKVISKGTCHFVFFRDGKITSTKNPAEEVDPLETYIAKRALLPHDALDRVAALRRKTGMDVQDLLQKEGLLSREDIQGIFEAMVEEDIFELITIRNAAYEFETEERSSPLPNGALVAEIGPILMEGARKADEITEMLRALGGVDGVLVLTPAGRDRGKVAEDEETILALVNGVRSIDGILDDAELDRYTATRILFDCAKKGLVGRLKGAARGGRDEDADSGQFDLRRAATWALPVIGFLGATLYFSSVLTGDRTDDPLLGEWLSRTDRLRHAKLQEGLRMSVEAYRVKAGGYPDSLEALADEGFISKDVLVLGDQPLWEYRREAGDSTFVLLPHVSANDVE